MALLYIDSFDHYATADGPAKGWSYVASGGSPSVGPSSGNGRNSTSSLRVAAGVNSTVGAELGVSGVSGTTCVVGFAFKRPTIAVTWPIVSIVNGSTELMTLNVTTTGAIEIRRGSKSGTLITTSVATLSAGTFYFLEWKVLLSDTVGTYELKIDGASAFSGTGADTVASGSAAWTGLRFVYNGSALEAVARTFDIDDLYVCDGSGGSNDTFLGDHRIMALNASTGNGTHTDWAPSTGTDRGALVDETTPNTSDYVLGSSSGQRATFNFPALGVTGTVKAVQSVNYIKADVSGVRYAGPSIVSGGTTYDSSGVSVGSDWTYQRTLHLTDPNTSAAWTVSGIDAAEFGMKVTA